LLAFKAHAKFRNRKVGEVTVLQDYGFECTLISEKLIQKAEAGADICQSQGSILTGPNGDF
jgi:hypothetical protein